MFFYFLLLAIVLFSLYPNIGLTYTILIGVIAIIGGILFLIIRYYNSLRRKSNKIEEAKSTISIYLTHRQEELESLQSLIHSVTNHEQIIYTKISEWRQRLSDELEFDNLLSVHNRIEPHIPLFLGRLEQYPELQSNDLFHKLHEVITDNEDNITATRKHYNICATNYNTAISLFPGFLLARLWRFSKVSLYVQPTTKEVF